RFNSLAADSRGETRIRSEIGRCSLTLFFQIRIIRDNPRLNVFPLDRKLTVCVTCWTSKSTELLECESMQAETLNCPNCGAATSTDAPLCKFCGSRLATVACPACFAMMFLGSKHCPRCGAAAATPKINEAEVRKCPRCQTEMPLVTIGAATVR